MVNHTGLQLHPMHCQTTSKQQLCCRKRPHSAQLPSQQCLLLAVIIWAVSSHCVCSWKVQPSPWEDEEPAGQPLHVVGHHQAHTLRTQGTECDPATKIQLWVVSLRAKGVPKRAACVARTSNSCDTMYGSGNYAVLRAGDARDGGLVVGCLQLMNHGINQRCPANFPFAWYVATGYGKFRHPALKECWADNGGHDNCGEEPFKSTFSVAALAASIAPVNATNLAGCTPTVGEGNAQMFCPLSFPFFAASSAGVLPNPTPGQSSCASSPPDCEAFKKVPVVDSHIGDGSGTVLGCLGTARQLEQNEVCPATVPHPASRVTPYTFFIAAGTNGEEWAAARVIECRKRIPSNLCGGLLPARHYDRVTPDGCFTGHIVVCPAGKIGYARYEFDLFGPQDPMKSVAPILRECSTKPPGFKCDNVAGGTYIVPVTNGGLNGSPAPTALLACQTSETSCLSYTHYPILNETGKIVACHSVLTTCPANHVPMCRNGQANGVIDGDGGCQPRQIAGCIHADASVEVCWRQNARGYPTVLGFPYFVASLIPLRQAGWIASTLQACYSTKASACSEPGAASDALRTYSVTAAIQAADGSIELNGELQVWHTMCLNDISCSGAARTCPVHHERATALNSSCPASCPTCTCLPPAAKCWCTCRNCMLNDKMHLRALSFFVGHNG